MGYSVILKRFHFPPASIYHIFQAPFPWACPSCAGDVSARWPALLLVAGSLGSRGQLSKYHDAWDMVAGRDGMSFPARQQKLRCLPGLLTSLFGKLVGEKFTQARNRGTDKS